MATLIFISVLSILIVVHEMGHFLTAKSLGVRVERFSLGFGPKLFSRKIKGTEFLLCLIPLGGYVKMAGEERQECKGEKDEFYSQPPGKRALIVSFGPIVNYFLAYLCFYFVFLTGYPTIGPKVGELISGYPAQISGLAVGDKIVKIDSKDIASWEDIPKYIAHSKIDALNFVILRDGQRLEKSIVPRIETLENIFGQKEKVRLIGIKPKEEIIYLKYGPFSSLEKSFTRLSDITVMTYKALYRMATGAMSAKESMTGPIGIFYILQKAAAMGFSHVLYIVAIISASLAIFNLLPLPVLDGGHLFFLGIEKIRGKALSPKVDEVIGRVGLSFLIGIAIFVFYSDFERFGWIDKIAGVWRGLGF